MPSTRAAVLIGIFFDNGVSSGGGGPGGGSGGGGSGGEGGR